MIVNRYQRVVGRLRVLCWLRKEFVTCQQASRLPYLRTGWRGAETMSDGKNHENRGGREFRSKKCFCKKDPEDQSEGAQAPHDPLMSINNRSRLARYFLERPESFRDNHSHPNRFRFLPSDLGTKYKNFHAKSSSFCT